MNNASAMRADYGLDAPPVVRNLAVIGVVCFVGAIVISTLLGPVLGGVATPLSIWALVVGISMVGTAGLMLWSSRVGKLRERERLMDIVGLRGDEQVLDVGCGRGVMLIGAAKRLKTGKAVGIDLWQSQDQSGNRPEMLVANAQAEGVADRVEVKTGDMRHMPFPDGTFDVVVSSLAIHNIYDKDSRAEAMREIVRVLKPGGRLALLDFQRTEEYEQTLRDLGWVNVRRSGPHFLMFPPVRIVTGKKPVSSVKAATQEQSQTASVEPRSATRVGSALDALTEPADKGHEAGITALDLVELSPGLYRFMQIMLRSVEMTYPQLCEAIDALPESERISRDELDKALGDLRDQRWLVVSAENNPITYKVNFRRKVANVTNSFAPKRKSDSISTAGLWDALDDQTSKKKP